MRFWFYTVRAIWRGVNGRWFVWRDAPTDVVRKAAALWYTGRNDSDPDHVNVLRQAREEYKLRKRRGTR